MRFDNTGIETFCIVTGITKQIIKTFLRIQNRYIDFLLEKCYIEWYANKNQYIIIIVDK